MVDLYTLGCSPTQDAIMGSEGLNVGIPVPLKDPKHPSKGDCFWVEATYQCIPTFVYLSGLDVNPRIQKIWVDLVESTLNLQNFHSTSGSRGMGSNWKNARIDVDEIGEHLLFLYTFQKIGMNTTQIPMFRKQNLFFENIVFLGSMLFFPGFFKSKAATLTADSWLDQCINISSAYFQQSARRLGLRGLKFQLCWCFETFFGKEYQGHPWN